MQQLPPQPTMPEIPHNQVVAGPAKKPSVLVDIVNKTKERFSDVLTRLTIIPPKGKKVLTVILAFIIVLALVSVFVPLVKKLLQKKEEETPTAQTDQLTLTTRKPSRYATDEAVLKTEGDVTLFESELNSLTVKESNLNPPPLNWDVNFKE